MPRYREIWVTTAVVTTMIGIWAAVVTWPLLELLICFVFVAVFAASMHAAIQATDAPLCLRKSLAVGAGAGAAAVGVVGLASLIGGIAVLVLVGAAATCPLAVRWLQHHLPGPTHTTATPQPPPVNSADSANDKEPPSPASPLAVAGFEQPGNASLDSLDDAALCRAWRRSYSALHHAESMPAILQVVATRQCYLDELERRNPTGLAAWLASGPRAASDPSRYILQRHRSEPPSVA